MILEIKKYPSPVLKNKAEEVLTITPEVKESILDMIEIVKKEKGIGLAAPQVGVSKRIIVIETEKGVTSFINPEILEKSKEKAIEEEGCLSLPGLYLKIKRAKKIEIRAKNIEGEELKIKAEGLLARVFQHEIDHLDGILIINRIGLLQRLRLRQKLKNF